MAFSNAENERQLLEYKMTMNEHNGMIDLEQTPVTNEPKNRFYKYSEDKILKDIENYVISTYGSH